MASDTDLVNAALRRVSGQRITDISQSVGSAGIAQDVLDFERDDLLRTHAWNFATARAKLGRLATAPEFGFQYAFAQPADWLRTLEIVDNDAGVGTVPYKLESLEQSGSYINVVACDAEEVWSRYIRRVTDANLMTVAFRQCLVLKLARVFATAVAESNTLVEIIDDEFRRAIRQAKSTDGIEDYPEQLPEGSWAQTRRGWWQRGHRSGF